MRSPISSLTALILWLGWGLPLASAGGAAPSILGDRPRALALVRQGVVDLNAGDYLKALAGFRQAYRVYPSVKIQFNIAQAYRHLGRYVDAVQAYRLFVAGVSAATPEVALANKYLAELSRRVAEIRVETTPSGAKVTIDGRPRGPSPSGPVLVTVGTHVVVASLAGYEKQVETLELRGGERRTVRVRLRKPRPKVVRKVVQVVYKTISLPRKGLPLLWAGIAVTAAAAVAAAVVGGLALREQSTFDDTSLSRVTRLAAGRRGTTYQRATDGLLISGGIVAAASLVWYLVRVRRSGGTRRIRVTPGAPEGAGALTLRF